MAAVPQGGADGPGAVTCLATFLLDSVFGVGVGDVVRQFGGHDTWLDERYADVGSSSCRSDSDQPLMPHLVAA